MQSCCLYTYLLPARHNNKAKDIFYKIVLQEEHSFEDLDTNITFKTSVPESGNFLSTERMRVQIEKQKKADF